MDSITIKHSTKKEKKKYYVQSNMNTNINYYILE